MSDNKMQYPERAGDIGTLMGRLKDFFGQFRLAWELLWDNRVSFVAKIIPILTLLYVISPVDIISGWVVPGIGALDDLAVFLIGLRLFVDVCPPALVAEHRQEDAQPEITVTTSATEQSAPVAWTPSAGQIIDLEAKEVPPNIGALPDSEVKPKAPIPHVW